MWASRARDEEGGGLKIAQSGKKKLYLFHLIHSTFLVALQIFYHEKLETDGMELKITMGPKKIWGTEL